MPPILGILLPGPSTSNVEVASGKLNRCKSSGDDYIPAEKFQAGGKTLRTEIHKLTNLIWNKEKLPHNWKELLVVPIHKKANKTNYGNYLGALLLSISYKILSNILLDRQLHMHMKLLRIINEDFDVIDQRRIKFSTADRYGRNNGSTMVQYISYS
jgi:hypothetical protein